MAASQRVCGKKYCNTLRAKFVLLIYPTQELCFFFFFSYLLFVLIRLWFIESHSGLLRPLLGHVNFIQRLTEIATSHNPLISFYYSVGENVFETTGRKIHPIF